MSPRVVIGLTGVLVIAILSEENETLQEAIYLWFFAYFLGYEHLFQIIVR